MGKTKTNEYAYQTERRGVNGSVTDTIRNGQPVLYFRSWEAMLNYAQQSFTMKHPEDQQRQSIENGREFTGTDSWQEAMILARNWNAGADKMREGLRKQQVVMPSSLKKNGYKLVDKGRGRISVGRYVEGHPKHVIQRSVRRSDEKILRVTIPAAYSGGIDQDDVLEYGQRLVSWIEQIENAGIKCELTLDYSLRGSVNVLVLLKAASAPLNLSRNAFGMAHPSALRRVQFAVQERWHTLKDKTVPCGYGNCITPNPNDSMFGHVQLPFPEGNWGDTMDHAFRLGLGI